MSMQQSYSARHNGQRFPQVQTSAHRTSEGAATVFETEPSAKSPLVKGLGWFSIGLGLLQLTAPSRMARIIGLKEDADHRALMKTLGLRELATGVGILTQRHPATMVVARVAGDIMDLVLLGATMRSERENRARVAIATAAVAGVTLLDLMGAREFSGGLERGTDELVSALRQRKPRLPSGHEGLSVTRSITVHRSPNEIYLFWRELKNLPRFMSHLESVESLGNGRSRWTAKAPLGTSVQWEAEILEDVPNELISWRSIPGSQIENEGEVRFRPRTGDRGTEIVVKLSYRPPAGAIGAAFAKLFGEAPEQQIAADLRALKQVLEVGEIVHSDASIHRGAHPARPSDAGETR